MTRWSYLGVELGSGEVLEALPLTGVKLSRQLDGHGSLSGTLSLKGRPQAKCDRLVDAIDAGRRAIYAIADGQPQWGGMSWADPDQDGDVIAVTAGEWGSYFAKRVLRESLTFTGADQLDIARALLDSAQAVPGGDMGIVSDPAVLSGVARDRSYLPGDLPVIGELLTNLGNVNNGFDWAWPVEWADRTHLRGRLLLGYPRLGILDDEDVQYAVTLRRARSIGMDRSAADMATTSWAVGKPANDGDPTPVLTATDPALLDGGYAVLDRVERYQDVTDLTTLQAHADADQQAAGGPLVAIKATVPITDVLAGHVGLGDPVKAERYGKRDGTAGFVAVMRCTGYELDPKAATAALTLSPRVTLGGRVPDRPDDVDRIARLNREVRMLTVSR